MRIKLTRVISKNFAETYLISMIIGTNDLCYMLFDQHDFWFK